MKNKDGTKMVMIIDKRITTDAMYVLPEKIEPFLLGRMSGFYVVLVVGCLYDLTKDVTAKMVEDSHYCRVIDHHNGGPSIETQLREEGFDI